VFWIVVMILVVVDMLTFILLYIRKGRLNQLVEMKNPDKDDAIALLHYFSGLYKLPFSVLDQLIKEVTDHFGAIFCAKIPINGAELRRRCQEAAMDNVRSIITTMNSSGIVGSGSASGNSS
jgi:ATP-dependent 26S proteasome regulatory subunit